MGHYRLLLVGIYPVENVDGFGFGIVVGLDLFFEQRQQKRLEIKVAVEQAELSKYDLIALEALGALVLIELFVEITFYSGACGEGALDGALDGQSRFIGREFDELVDQGKKMLGLLGSNSRDGFARRFGGLIG
jgi:hypothetical protein